MRTVVIAVLVVIVVVIVGVGAFLAGSSYGQAQAQNVRSQFFASRQNANGGQFGQPGQAGQRGQGNFAGGRPVAAGTVKSVQGDTIEVTEQNGNTVTVTVNGQTSIEKTVNGTKADLTPGTRVTVMGSQNGSNDTATLIQVRGGP
ncbi:MAG: DUF5666 domain-containing protein [Chloroflexi bacterium]|nr:DUF5666 domain-containing protein [Chloroflexota bacterium]